jgi:prephenate dehydrogenase
MHTVAIVGTGLIGTSVALALRGRGVTTYLLDRDPNAARAAEARGAGTAGQPPEPVDLAVLAVPPTQVAAVLREQQNRGLARSYTDVASVKRLPHAAAVAAGCRLASYVGGHPLAGSERSGPLAARGDLFQNRVWVLTPSASSDAVTLARVRELVSWCGARPVVMEPADHDRAVALSSHAPHLVAAVLAARLRDAPAAVLQLCGPGVRDTTRIAAGDADLWADILAGNAAEVAGVLAEVAADLGTAEAALRSLPAGRDTGRATLVDLLRRGAAGRARIRAAEPVPERT